MVIFALSHAVPLAKRIAKLADIPYSELFVERFPDSELHLKFQHTIPKNRKVYLVQSFYGNVDSCLMEVLLAAVSAKERGASSVALLAPFFPYLRQDKEFTPGEINSQHILGKIVSKCLDEIYILDPHLHREKNLGHIFFVPAHKLTANPLIAQHIKTHIKHPLIVGPDWESYKWAEKVAEELGAESTILEKSRHSARDVDVKFTKDVEIKGRHAVLIDDMISTGNTLLKTIKKLQHLGAKKITCYAVHGIFVEGALEKLLKTGAEVITTNSIPSEVAKIDVAELFAERIR